MECECYDPNMLSHLSKVLHGEYDIPIILNNPVILDMHAVDKQFIECWID